MPHAEVEAVVKRPMDVPLPECHPTVPPSLSTVGVVRGEGGRGTPTAQSRGLWHGVVWDGLGAE